MKNSILIIEDDKSVQQLIRMYLVNDGFEVIFSIDGEDGLNKALTENPDLILLEGQSSLRNPSGPCGSELLCSAMAKGVILQYAPKQKYFLADYDRKILSIPPIEEELELIKLYGSKTLALTITFKWSF